MNWHDLANDPNRLPQRQPQSQIPTPSMAAAGRPPQGQPAPQQPAFPLRGGGLGRPGLPKLMGEQ